MNRLILVILALMALMGCKTVEVQTVERVRTDTLRQMVVQRDSIYLHDSTFVRVAGDTILMERWHTRWRDRLRTDTIYQSRVDSVPKPYPVVKEVPADLSWWQRTRMFIGSAVLVAAVIAAGAWITKKKFM